ncbi:MAG: zf-HC2 domain-containing protein [marine benthic group bacterium]|nr:zf-HC2 domain-containing protein [Gemmatimonadota bacterium]
MTDWTEKLSDYLDGDLSGDELAKLEAALQGDAALRGVLEELRAVKDTAASLPQHAPLSDLWSGIEARIEADRLADVVPLSSAGNARRRFSFTIPQLAAAAVALLVLGSASVWMAMSSGAGGLESGSPIAVAPAPEAGFVSAPGDGSTFSYEATIQDLEQQLQVGRDRLDPKTVATLEGSLATIDRAIARAQEALEADPASVYLNRHLADARTRKLHVLQQAARLARS